MIFTARAKISSHKNQPRIERLEKKSTVKENEEVIARLEKTSILK